MTDDYDHADTKAENGETGHKQTPEPDFHDFGVRSISTRGIILEDILDE